MRKWATSILLLSSILSLAACSASQRGSEASEITQLQAGSSLVFELQSQAAGEMDAAALSSLLQSTADIVRRRVDASGVSDATIAIQQPNRIEVRVPGFTDTSDLAELIASPGQFSFHLVDVSVDRADLVKDTKIDGRVVLPDDSNGGQLEIVFIDPVITSSDLAGASVVLDQANFPAISIKLKRDGARKLGDATKHNVGRSLAIVIDNRILSTPRIVYPILSGDGMITGDFTRDEAERLAIILRSGSLPLRLQLIEISAFGESSP